MSLSVRLLAEILLLKVVLLCFHVMQAVQLSMSDTVLALQTKEIVSPINAIVLSAGSILKLVKLPR